MRAVHFIDLSHLAAVFGSGDTDLVAAILRSDDAGVCEGLEGMVACNFDPAAVLRAVVAGDVRGHDLGAVMQAFDIVVCHLGAPTSFLDEAWASDRALTALHDAKVDDSRGLRTPLPWPVVYPRTELPFVYVWTQADLALLAAELDAAITRAPPDLAVDFAAISTRVAEVRATGLGVVEINWL